MTVAGQHDAVASSPTAARRPRGRRLVVGLILLLLLPPALVLGSGHWVRSTAEGHVYQVATVPAAPVAIVLGAQVRPDGTPSAFLAARLDVARRLLAAGTVRAILVSGDNRTPEYDEPGAMRRWLVDRGVPPARVVGDPAGLDTYDSCLRARRVFGVEQAVVVTQSFHIERAVTVCRAVGIDAVGVGDDSVRAYERAWRYGDFRERFAAVKAAYDVLSGRDPVRLDPADPALRDALAR